MTGNLYRIGLLAQSLLYIVAGTNHFWHTATYTVIMPPHYSSPDALVRVSGAAEVLGGMGLLVPCTRRAAAWGILVMLLVYFDVHIFMLQNASRFQLVPKWALAARLPLQFVLIYWAWIYARRAQDQTPRLG